MTALRPLNPKENLMSELHLASRSAPLGVTQEPITGLWFWDCRICPGFPTVGHHSTHPGAVALALRHAADSSGHRHAAEDLAAAPTSGAAL